MIKSNEEKLVCQSSSNRRSFWWNKGRMIESFVNLDAMMIKNTTNAKTIHHCQIISNWMAIASVLSSKSWLVRRYMLQCTMTITDIEKICQYDKLFQNETIMKSSYLTNSYLDITKQIFLHSQPIGFISNPCWSCQTSNE